MRYRVFKYWVTFGCFVANWRFAVFVVGVLRPPVLSVFCVCDNPPQVELIVFITHPPSRDLLQLVPVFPSSNRIVPSAVFMCFWLFSPDLSGRV